MFPNRIGSYIGKVLDGQVCVVSEEAAVVIEDFGIVGIEP